MPINDSSSTPFGGKTYLRKSRSQIPFDFNGPDHVTKPFSNFPNRYISLVAGNLENRITGGEGGRRKAR